MPCNSFKKYLSAFEDKEKGKSQRALVNMAYLELKESCHTHAFLQLPTYQGFLRMIRDDDDNKIDEDNGKIYHLPNPKGMPGQGLCYTLDMDHLIGLLSNPRSWVIIFPSHRLGNWTRRKFQNLLGWLDIVSSNRENYKYILKQGSLPLRSSFFFFSFTLFSKCYSFRKTHNLCFSYNVNLTSTPKCCKYSCQESRWSAGDFQMSLLIGQWKESGIETPGSGDHDFIPKSANGLSPKLLKESWIWFTFKFLGLY